MAAFDPTHERRDELVERLVELLERTSFTVGVAESLTGGELTARLARGPGAGTWFRGGIVAYSSEVKRSLLGVGGGPVVSRPAAEAMAAGATRVLGADVAVAVTGVGGPEPQDGHDPGTVCWAVNLQGASTGGSVLFEGSPAKVIESTVTMALEQLAFALANQM